MSNKLLPKILVESRNTDEVAKNTGFKKYRFFLLAEKSISTWMKLITIVIAP